MTAFFSFPMFYTDNWLILEIQNICIRTYNKNLGNLIACVFWIENFYLQKSIKKFVLLIYIPWSSHQLQNSVLDSQTQVLLVLPLFYGYEQFPDITDVWNHLAASLGLYSAVHMFAEEKKNKSAQKVHINPFNLKYTLSC